MAAPQSDGAGRGIDLGVKAAWITDGGQQAIVRVAWPSIRHA